jgi:hypothetical protein
MGISSLVSRAIPIAVGAITGGPIGAASAAVATEAQKKQEKRNKRIIAERQQQERNLLMAIGDPMFRSGIPTTTTLNLGSSSPSFFDRLGGLASNVGNTLLSGLESAVPSLIQRQIFGSSRPQSASQGPALTTITNVGAQESQGSGTIQAGAGALLPSILGGARSLLKSPAGQLALGGGSALAFSGMGTQPSGMRITRKMKSQARMIVNMVGGDLSQASSILGIDENTLVMILLKRFRNDGPVVTKAALRKTKSTIRKLHNMQDVLKSITPTASGRKRAPMKRATTTTLIKN